MSTVPRPSQSDKTIALYLLIFPNRLFKAHWSLFIPCVQAQLLKIRPCSHIEPEDGTGAQAVFFDKGLRMHVTGDLLNGFEHAIEWDYSIQEDDRHPKTIFLGEISRSCDNSTLSHATVGEFGGRIGCLKISSSSSSSSVERPLDGTVNDNRNDLALQHVIDTALGTPAPGKGLRSVDHDKSKLGIKAHKLDERKDCQWWIKEVVRVMADHGMISKDAISIVAAAPQN